MWNPRVAPPAWDLPSLPAHIWIGTSGNSCVALSKEAFLVSAQAVNAHLGATAQDQWIHVLPDFHVGGLGIWARSFLSGATVHKMEWNPHQFALMKGTLASIVPTHIYDLVSHQLHAPPHLRALIVGGGALSPSLYTEALELGWPIVLTYGMTEAASQIATSQPRSSHLEILSHIHCRCEETLWIKGASLLTGFFKEGEWVDPKVEGWYPTSDRVTLQGSRLIYHARGDEQIKIGGELVDLALLRLLWTAPHSYLIAREDVRLGKHVALLYEGGNVPDIAAFNAAVRPFERIRSFERLERLPRTELGKIKYSAT